MKTSITYTVPVPTSTVGVTAVMPMRMAQHITSSVLMITASLCILGTLSSCFTPRKTSSADTHSIDSTEGPVTADTTSTISPISEDNYAARIQQIENELDIIMNRDDPQSQSSGRGAYKQGPRQITGTAGDETLLDRLYNAETNLKKTRDELNNKQQSIATLKQSVINNSLLIKSLELKAELYEKNRGKIATLQDDRKHTQIKINDVQSHLIESELKLLTLQSDHFNFARIILELEPGDTQGFLDLQEHIKQMTLELNPNGKETVAPTVIEEDIK